MASAACAQTQPARVSRIPQLAPGARLRRAGIVLAVLSLVALASALAPGAARADGYGLGLSTTGGNDTFGNPGAQGENVATCADPSQVPCSAGNLQLQSPFTRSGYFGQLLNAFGSPAFVRFWIPYDALAYWNGHGCTASPYYFAGANGTPSGGQQFAQLIWNLQAAQQLGLTPDVQIAAGSGQSDPVFPDPSYGNGSTYMVGLTTGGHDYYCGAQALVRQITADLGAGSVTQFEAANEPNTYPPYQGSLRGSCSTRSNMNPCGGLYNTGGYVCGSNFSSCGALEDAMLWMTAEEAIKAGGFTGIDMAAMTFTPAYDWNGGVTAYLTQLKNLANCARRYACSYRGYWPYVFAVHDYEDVAQGGHPGYGNYADVQNFLGTLKSQLGSSYQAHVWITETGAWLQDNSGPDKNGPGCGPTNTLGPCINGNASAQYAAGTTWLNLIGWQSGNILVTEVYWYELQTATGDTFDSALLDPAGRPRESFCAITGQPFGGCQGSPWASG